MKALSAHNVARTMLILEGWRKPLHIGREAGIQCGTPYRREVLAYRLARLRAAGRAERQRATHGNGYEWQLTSAGIAFAIAPPPADEPTADAAGYNHRGLAAAMGMLRQISPSGDSLRASLRFAHITVHTINKKGQR